MRDCRGCEEKSPAYFRLSVKLRYKAIDLLIPASAAACGSALRFDETRASVLFSCRTLSVLSLTGFYKFNRPDNENKIAILFKEMKMLRQEISQALTTAMKAHEKMRASTLRLIMAALKDRDIANRGAGKDPVSDDEILAILAKMIKQREESAKMYEEGNRIELAENERAEIEIIREFLPQQLSDEEIRANSAAAIAEIGAEGLRDMGKVMAVLKERYTGQMDFAKASGVLKELLGS